jgi:hypothetical protein
MTVHSGRSFIMALISTVTFWNSVSVMSLAPATFLSVSLKVRSNRSQAPPRNGARGVFSSHLMPISASPALMAEMSKLSNSFFNSILARTK